MASETPEQLMARMNATYGISSTAQQAVATFNNLHLQASEGSSNSFQLRQDI